MLPRVDNEFSWEWDPVNGIVTTNNGLKCKFSTQSLGLFLKSVLQTHTLYKIQIYIFIQTS